MKKYMLVFINIAMLIPCLFMVIGIIPFEIVYVLAFVISLVNVCFAKSTKKFVIYNSILFVCLAAGILLDYYARKTYGVGFHPGVTQEYQLLMMYYIGSAVMITGIEVILRHFLQKTH